MSRHTSFRLPGQKVRLRWTAVALVVIALGSLAWVTGGVTPVHSSGGTVPLLGSGGTLTAGAVTPAAPGIDDGQSVTLTAHPTGGSGTYTIQWFSGGGTGSCSAGTPVGSNSSTFATPTLSQGGSPYYYCYAVNDTLNASASSAWDGITVNPTLTTPATPTVNATAIDANQSLKVTDAIPSSGTPPYSWSWLVATNGGGYTAALVCTSPSGTQGAANASEACRVPAGTLTAGNSYTFEFRVSDNGTPSETTTSPSSATVTVSSGLSAGSISPAAPSIDKGQSVTLSSNPSGGTTPYSLTWYSASSASGACSSGASIGTSAQVSVAPSTSTYYCYVASDQAQPPQVQSSGWDKVTVNSALTAGSPTPLSPIIDFGQSITLTAVPAGGTPSYSYHWYWASSSTGACTSGKALGSSPTQTTGSEISGPGTYSYCYTVTDSSGANSGHASASSPWDNVTVNAGLPSPAAPTVSARALDADQPLKVTGVIPSGGTPPYSWAWLASSGGGAYAPALACATSSGSGAASGQNVTCAVSANALTAGTNYSFELQVTDHSASAKTAKSAPSPSVSVKPALTSPGAPVPNATTLDANQPLSVSGKMPSTGTSTYSWQWWVSTNGGAYGAATICGSSSSGRGAASGASEACKVPGGTLTASTSYTFEMSVTDSATTPETTTSPASPTVRTSSVLSAGTPTPAAATIDLGQIVNLTAAPSGGTAPYAYQWYAGATGSSCTALTSPISGATSVAYSASPALSTYYCYAVTDARSNVATSSASVVQVNPALLGPTPPVPTATVLDADQSVQVSTDLPTTGTAPYSWQWLVSVNGSAFTNSTLCSVGGTGGEAGSTVSCSIPGGTLAPGSSYRFILVVGDNATPPESARSGPSATVSVSTALTAPPGPNTSSTTLTTNLSLTVSDLLPTTGSLPYSWQWLVSVNGTSFENATLCSQSGGSGGAAGATVTCTIPADTLAPGGTYRFVLTVTDSASVPESIVSPSSSVVEAFGPLIAGIPSPRAPGIDLGQSINLTANPSGGTGGYTYQWYAGSSASACTSLASPVEGATSGTFTGAPTVSTYYCYEVSSRMLGANASSTVVSPADLVTVNPALSAPPTPSLSSSTPSVGETVTVSGPTPTTGTAPYSWLWLVSIDGSPFGPATQCGTTAQGSGAAAGTIEACQIPPNTLQSGHSYTFELEVTDSAVVPKTTISGATGAIQVQAAGPGGSPVNLASFLPFIAAVLLLVVIAVVGTMQLRRRRQRTRPHAAPPLSAWEAVPAPPTAPVLSDPVAASEPGAFPIPEPGLGPVTVPPPTASLPPSVPSAERPARSEEAPADFDSVLEELEHIRAELARRTSKPAGTTSTPPTSDSGRDGSG